MNIGSKKIPADLFIIDFNIVLLVSIIYLIEYDTVNMVKTMLFFV